MDEARTILTTSNWEHTQQTILATISDPRHDQGTIPAPTSGTRRTLRAILTVLTEAHRRLSAADDDELDAATATASIDDEPSDDYDSLDGGESDAIEEEEAERGAEELVVDYGEAYRDGGFGGAPASAAAMADRITERKFHEIGGGADEETTKCMICIEDFEAGDDLGEMPCTHSFHQCCLVQWLARSRLCPCCRHALPSEAQTPP